MKEGRYYIVYDCSDCPNMREYCSITDSGDDKYLFKCVVMGEKEIRKYPIIPQWCPLKKV